MLAGHAAGEPEPGVEVRDLRPEELQGHPVTDVHVAASGTIALESYGLVASEAQALGLPLVPWRVPSAERFSEGEGVFFYEQGSAAGLAAVLERLATEPGLLEVVRGRAVPAEDDEATIVDLLEGLYRRPRRGPPEAPAPAWYEDRLAELAAEAWDDEVKARTRADLGSEDEAGA